MSDLHCPATLLLARHGHTAYVETWFSDEGGWLTREGRAQAVALADAVRPRRVARVFSSDTSRAVQTAEVVAARLSGAGPASEEVVTRKGLREVFAGDLVGQPFDAARLRPVTDRWFAGDLAAAFPGGESGHDVVARYEAALTEIADEHRGETVLVVVHQTAAAIAVPVLCGVPLATARERALAHGQHAEIAHDADGWRLLSSGAGPGDPAG